jgi:hypothetical protein
MEDMSMQCQPHPTVYLIVKSLPVIVLLVDLFEAKKKMFLKSKFCKGQKRE